MNAEERKNAIAEEAAGVYYDANEFFQDLGGREAFIWGLKPYIIQAINNWERDIYGLPPSKIRKEKQNE